MIQIYFSENVLFYPFMHLAFINTIYNLSPPLITPQPTQPVYQLPLQVTST